MINLNSIISQAEAADVSALRKFLFDNPERPLVATGSGGAETVADFAALLYGARGGMSTAVTPYTMNSYGDAALKTAKLLLVSKSGHNDDIAFAARRGLAVNPEATASFTLHTGEKNKVRKIFTNAGSALSFDIPGLEVHDGFVSTETPVMYFALLCRVFDPGCDLGKYKAFPKRPFRFERNDGSALAPEDLRTLKHYVILHGSWGRPVAENLEGKLVESGFSLAGVYDYRNFCHGRFIFISNHLEDSAVVLFVTPRERDIVERTRKWLPASTKLIIIETESDAPEASLDLLIRTSAYYAALCEATGTNYEKPKNPASIDKRVPMNVPFKTELRNAGPLKLDCARAR